MTARRLLGLAATPVFAAMALVSASAGDHACGEGGVAGMGTMYALMALFHAAPWLPGPRESSER